MQVPAERTPRDSGLSTRAQPSAPRLAETTAGGDRRAGEAVTRRLLGIIAAVLVIGALKLASPVALPLALAILLLAIVWPIQERLESHLGGRWGTLVSMMTVFALMAVFVAAMFVATRMIAEQLPNYQPVVQQRYQSIVEWMSAKGVPFEPDRDDIVAAAGRALSVFGSGIQGVYSLVGRLVLALLFLMFGLLELPALYRKLRKAPDDSPTARVLLASKTIGRRYRQYMWTKALTSALTGVATTLFCWALGLDLAFVWGLVAFVLNFIPNIGSMIAVIPPTILAFLQFDDHWYGLLTLIGLAFVQFSIGSYVDPRMQGKNLKLSPFVVLLSIVFWGWMWGVVGALVGVPMTVGALALCRNFERTKWVSVLLADLPAHD